MYRESELKDLVALTDGKPVATSRQVAKRFGKRHDNILQLFQTRIIGRHSEEFNRLNFQVVDYIDAKGETRQEILMTKDGFIAIWRANANSPPSNQSAPFWMPPFSHRF